VAGDLLISGAVEQPILHEAQQVGSVRVAGDPVALLHFLLQGAGPGSLSAVDGAGGALHVRRMLRDVVDPLRNLMRVAHAVRSERAFGQRMPPARIEELNALSEDFNVLLDDSEAWQNQLQHENRSLAHRASQRQPDRLAQPRRLH
jgi:hypothetical protein